MFSRRSVRSTSVDGVLLLVPLVLEVLQQEVAIADLAHFGREGEALGQLLAMLPEEAVAIVDVGLGQDAGPALAQVVGAHGRGCPRN